MNRAVGALLLAMLLVPATPGTAQDAEPILLMSDQTGDVEVTSNGQNMANPDRFQNLDITDVHAEESDLGFTFHVGIASDEPILIVETGHVALYFAHRDQAYRVAFDPVPWIGFHEFQTTDAELERHDPTTDEWVVVTSLEASLESNTYTALVPREYLIDQSGTAPFPGRSLTDFRAVSEGQMGIRINSNEPVANFYEARDDAEPAGEGAVLQVTKGFAQTGHVRLASDEPTRASNGEATTFVYELTAHSLDGSDDVVIEFANIPAGWTATASRSAISLDGEGPSSFLVKVDIPFAHKHGATDRLMVEAHSLRDPQAVGRVEVGVHYLDIPQLSGHHNTLYVHSRAWDGPVGFAEMDSVLYGRGDSIGFPFMNSLQDFDGNSGTPMVSDNLCSLCLGGDTLEYTWSVPLSPSLRMGIDMNMTQTGAFDFSFSTGRPLPGAVASGELVYVAPGTEREFNFGAIEGEPLAQLESVILGDVAALSTINYEGAVTPTAFGNYIEYERGAQVYLVLRLTSSLPPIANGHDNPLLEQGGSIQLPLNEYADTVADLSGFIISQPDEAALDAFETNDEGTSKATPGPAAWLAIGALALLRRRS